MTRVSMRQLTPIVMTLIVYTTVTASTAKHQLPIFGAKKQQQSKKPSSRSLSKLLAQSRSLEGQDVDFSYVASYSVKFQGCHHISQWNEDAEDEDDVRINTKRLVRFRLCPTQSCGNHDSSGCSSKYGDYIVDMNSFVELWLENQMEELENNCDYYFNLCAQECDDDDCYQACLKGYGMSGCLDGDDDGNGNKVDPLDYVACAQYEFDNNNRELEELRRRLDGDVQYYIGPYCADQGGEIHMGLFTDETCTTFSSCGESCFYENNGYELPYSDDSIVGENCLSCADNNNRRRLDGNVATKEVCENMYQISGKCETKMSVDYPNESACTYIEGIKIIREDGVIRTTNTRKSKAAAVCIGLFCTIAVLLGAYVYYLRTKLGRAKINLSAANTPLS